MLHLALEHFQGKMYSGVEWCGTMVAACMTWGNSCTVKNSRGDPCSVELRALQGPPHSSLWFTILHVEIKFMSRFGFY